MIPNLLRTALLGTEKQTFDMRLLPSALQPMLADTTAEEPEMALLKTITVYHYYAEAGKQPLNFEGDKEALISAEDKPFASEEYQDLYASIVALPPFARFACMHFWLDGFTHLNALVSPSNTIQLLRDFHAFSEEIQVKMVNAFGKKALFLLPFYTDFEQKTGVSTVEIWEEGKIKERRIVFQQLRQRNPQEALVLLQKTWHTETLPEKKAFVDEIAQTLVATDYDFLTQLWTEFSYKSQEKKGHKEIRWMLTGLLMKFEHSEVYQRITGVLASYVQAEKSKGVLGWVGKTELNFNLPTQDDAFFNAKSMDEQWGLVTPKDYDNLPTVYDYWLKNMLKITPMPFWEKTLNKTTEELLKYWQQEQYCQIIDRKKQPFLQNAFLHNARHFNNHTLVSLLSQQKDWVNFASVYQLLSQIEKEKLILQHKVHTDVFILNCCFDGTQEIWSVHFSKEIIKACYELTFKRNGYISDQLIALLAKHLHPSSIAFLANLDASVGQHQHIRQNWQQRLVDTLVMNLEIKEKIASIIS